MSMLKLTIANNASAAEVTKLIVSIQGRGAKLDTDIHSAALACLHHADEHGDITLMNRLLLAMPKSGRRNALQVWSLAFGKFMANPDAKSAKVAPLSYNREGVTNMDGAAAKPFWDFKNVKEGGEWSYTDYMDTVLKTLGKQATADTEQGRKAAAAMAALAVVK